MEYRHLGRSGLKVSALSLGTMTFGGKGVFDAAGNVGVKEARKMIDMSVEAGINLLDTANMYSVGVCEEIIGEAIHGEMPDLLIATKARAKMGPGPNDEGLSRWHIIREVERSLKRLRRDRLDIFYLHEWDGSAPLDESLAACETMIQQGKIRYIGCSNHSAWHVMKGLAFSDKHGHSRYVTQQIHYTPEAREAEYELIPLSVDQGVGILIWSPLAGGLLSGKYTRGEKTGRMLKGWFEPPIRDENRLWNIVDTLIAIGKNHGVSAAQVAIAWGLTRPAVSSSVIGARSIDQLKDNLAAANLKLSAEDVKQINDISAPPVIYPYWHQYQQAKSRFGAADNAFDRSHL
jgi:aryl-alcohol dehydrogenase-like predicted oxidoreductase